MCRFDGKDSCECEEGYTAGPNGCEPEQKSAPSNAGGSAPALQAPADDSAKAKELLSQLDQESATLIQQTFELYDSDRSGGISLEENLKVRTLPASQDTSIQNPGFESHDLEFWAKGFGVARLGAKE